MAYDFVVPSSCLCCARLFKEACRWFPNTPFASTSEWNVIEYASSGGIKGKGWTNVEILRLISVGSIVVGFTATAVGHAQEIGSPEGIKSEQALPDRYSCVVEDILKFCEPKRGFWIDLGAGKGQVAIPLIWLPAGDQSSSGTTRSRASRRCIAYCDRAQEPTLAAVPGVGIPSLRRKS